MKPRKPKCEYCRFWSDWRYMLRRDIELGWCQLHPPTAGDDGRAAWPQTHKLEFCGAFEDKRPPKPATGDIKLVDG